MGAWVVKLPTPEVRIAVSNMRAYSTGLCTQNEGFFVMAGNPDLYRHTRRSGWSLKPAYKGEDDHRNFVLTNPLGTMCEAHAVVLHEMTHWALFELLGDHRHDRVFKQMLINAGEEVVGRRFQKNTIDMTHRQVTDRIAFEFYKECL